MVLNVRQSTTGDAMVQSNRASFALDDKLIMTNLRGGLCHLPNLEEGRVVERRR